MAKNEDSGLIDLDALLRQASESERDLARLAEASRPGVPATAVAPPAPTLPPPPAPPPAPPTPDESLAGTSLRTIATANTTAAPIPARGHSRHRAVATAAALAALLCAAVIGHRAPSGGDAHRASHEATVRPASAAAAPTIEPRTEPDGHASPAIAAADLPSARSPRVAPEPTRTPAPSAQPHVTAVVLPDSPKGELADLGAAMRGAVGANDASANPVDPKTTTSAARTLHPSPGAVVGAINGVLPEARACLGADDAVRVASITFRSDGAVTLVELDGERATNACVRSALARAHVEPFVDPSFVTRVTVRP